jgi:3',5'-cyclic AMP phosphodiesterase CpdA
MRIAWATDIHLEFLTPPALTTFCISLASSSADAFLISGDISQARGPHTHLRILERTVERPVYFVLGNHDFYHGKIAEVRNQVREISGISSYLRWLPASGPVELAAGTGLLGHDGWADGRLGDYRRSPVLLNDYRLIDDFIGLDLLSRLALLNQLGDEAAEYLRGVLPEALARWKRLIVLTHVPPFAEAAWHLGRHSDENWLPHFSCRAVGEVLLEAARLHPDREIRVLCGHTHSGGEVDILPNLRVTTGWARYGEPAIQSEWAVD